MSIVAPPQFLVVATSGRALARSAYRSGHSICVLDLFADTDTRRYSSVCRKIASSEWGLDADSALSVATQYCPPPIPLIPGSGFENKTELLAALSFGRTLLGNRPETVSSIKDPAVFFSMLDDLGIPHPLTSIEPPTSPDGWLVKQVGANGGSHVRYAKREERPEEGKYFQKLLNGTAASVLFLADGFRCRVIGFNEIWCQGGREAPFAYAGAINHISLPEQMRLNIEADVQALVGKLGLVGINGIDFIASGDDYHVLEVNPRPTATMDLYEGQEAGLALFEMHLAACRGILPAALPVSRIVRAHAVVYAPKSFHLPANLLFPDWCSDLPAADSTFHANEPVCMVHAEGSCADAVKQMVERRRFEILNLLTG